MQEAATTLERAATRNPDNDWTFVYLAAAYGQLERQGEGMTALERANELQARVGRSSLTLQTVYRWRWIGDRELLLEGLAKAGVQTESGDWLSLVTNVASGHEVDGAEKIDVDKAKALYDGGARFVEVGQLRHWLTGRIPGARFLDSELLGSVEENQFNKLQLSEIVSRDRDVVIYCGDPWCKSAPTACARAATWGYQKVHYFRAALWPGGQPGLRWIRVKKFSEVR